MFLHIEWATFVCYAGVNIELDLTRENAWFFFIFLYFFFIFFLAKITLMWNTDKKKNYLLMFPTPNNFVLNKDMYLLKLAVLLYSIIYLFR